MHTFRTWRAAFLGALTLAAACAAVAQSYPQRPIRLLHGFAAGGNADVIARLLADDLGRRLGQPVVVEPKPGAGGTLASDAVAKAAPDGYTLLLATGGHAIAAAMQNRLPYDTIKSFQPISSVTSFPFMLVTSATSKHTSLQDLLAKAKSKPGTVYFGSAGVGTGQHMTGALLSRMANAPLTHVPYRGESAALTGLMTGEIDLVVAAATAAAPQVKAGKLRALATSGTIPWEGLPQVQAVAAQGVPRFEVKSWTALLAPANTPIYVVARLNTAVQQMLSDPATRTKLEETTGGTARASTPAELQRTMEADVKRWTQLVKDANIPKE